MKIKIAKRFKPFSHTPGVKLLLPGTTAQYQVFPSMMIEEGKEIPFHIKGPVKNFTVQQDLERGQIHIFGTATSGYFEKVIKSPNYQKPKERLHLGVNKKQEFDCIRRRLDLAEILPYWFFLGQVTPGETKLLNHPLEELFLAGFDGILSPRQDDEEHHGIDIEVPENLLPSGAMSIRRLFLEEIDNEIYLLHHLPKAFTSGRMLTEHIDFEWTKRKLRRVISRTKKPLHFPQTIKKYRTTETNGITYYDRFET